jgi:hypothetical protein
MMHEELTCEFSREREGSIGTDCEHAFMLGNLGAATLASG